MPFVEPLIVDHGDDGVPAVPSETSKTLARGIRVLEVLATAPEGLSVSALAARLQTHRAGVYRLLTTLSVHRLTVRAANGHYRLGPGLLSLSRNVVPRLQEAAAPVLAALANKTGATAYVSIADGDTAVVLTTMEPRQLGAHVAYSVGFRHPLALGAAGMAMLAGRSAIPGERPQVAEARQRGFATSRGELQSGARAIAAPIQPNGRPAEASVGVVSMSDLDVTVIASQVVQAARTISAMLSDGDY